MAKADALPKVWDWDDAIDMAERVLRKWGLLKGSPINSKEHMLELSKVKDNTKFCFG